MMIIECAQKIEMIEHRGRIIYGDSILFHQAQDDGQGVITDVENFIIEAKAVGVLGRWDERKFYIGGFD